jgi:hypothetical protein
MKFRNEIYGVGKTAGSGSSTEDSPSNGLYGKADDDGYRIEDFRDSNLSSMTTGVGGS